MPSSLVAGPLISALRIGRQRTGKSGLLQVLSSGRVQVDGSLRLTPKAAPASCTVGDLRVHTDNKLMICTVTGTPGTWVVVGTQA